MCIRPICRTEGCNRVVAIHHKNKKTGKICYYSWCHQCKDPGNLEKYIKNNKQYRKQVLDHYGCRCVVCGNSDERVLVMDHINNLGHLHRKNGIRITGPRLYREITEAGFPNTYQVLCRNCNWIKYLEWLNNHNQTKDEE